VQGAVPVGKPITEEDLQATAGTYEALTRTIPEDVQLILWPETAIPTRLNERPDLQDRIRELAIEKNAWMLVGAARSEGDATFNSLYLFSPEGKLVDTYSKVILVPFGEYVPHRERYKFLEHFPVRKFDFTHGEGFKVLDAAGHRFSPVICFEALFPHVSRQLTRMGAQIILVATSDEWAHDTPEIPQHSYTAPVRAVESRRYIVRAATWGISGIITPYGEWLATVPACTSGVAWDDVYPRTELSPYHRYGDLPLLLVCFAVWFAGLFGSLSPRRTGAREVSDA
ncbi:MAG: apolipoprotein N-acyltransferase, partial [Armatimonadetes bacterium]|nr:apolipoprotein N-acyltransferase [Armatimonadota bacterium]